MSGLWWKGTPGVRFRVLVTAGLLSWGLHSVSGVPTAAAQKPADPELLNKISDSALEVVFANDKGIGGASLRAGQLCKNYIEDALAAGIAKDTLIKWPAFRGVILRSHGLVLTDIKASDEVGMALASVSEQVCFQRGLIYGWKQKFAFSAHFILRRVRALQSPSDGDFADWQLDKTCPAKNLKSVIAEINKFIASDLADCTKNLRSSALEVPESTPISVQADELTGTSIKGPVITILDVADKVCNHAMRLSTQRLKQLKTQGAAHVQQTVAQQLAEDKQEAAAYSRFLTLLTGDKQSLFQSEKLLRRLPLRGRGGRPLGTPQDFAESAGWYSCTLNDTRLVPTWSVDGWRFSGDHLDAPYHETGIGAADCPSYAFP